MIAYFNSESGGYNAGTNTFYAPFGSSGAPNWFTTESPVYQPIPHALTLDQLSVSLHTAPGAGTSLTYTVMKNSVATSLAVTISNTNTSASDNTHTVSFSAGDTISLQSTHSGAAANPSIVAWTARQSASGMFAVLTRADNGYASADGTIYFSPQNNCDDSTTESDLQQPIPLAGTVENLYVVSNVSPTGTWTTNFRKNGAGSGLTAALSGSNTSANDTTHTVSVVAGDLIDMQIVPTSSPGTTRIGMGYSVAPTTDGQSFLMSGTSVASAAPNNATNYGFLTGFSAWNATESNRQLPAGATTAKALYVKFATAPGSGKSWAMTLRDGGADTTATVTVSNTNTSGNITGQSITINALDLLSLSSVPSSTPASTASGFGVLLSILPPTTQTQSGKASIASASTQTQTGKADIRVTTTKTQTGVAHLLGVNNQTITGKADIRVTTTQTQTGKANIRITTTKTQTGKANVVITTPQTQTGVARLLGTTKQTQTGKGYIAATIVHTQSGKSNIISNTPLTPTLWPYDSTNQMYDGIDSSDLDDIDDPNPTQWDVL